MTTAVAIFDDEGRVLLLEHVFRPDSGWGMPGGFLSSGEQPEAGVRREMREEIGIELEAVELLFARSLGRLRQIEIYFRARAVGIPEPRSFEIKTRRMVHAQRAAAGSFQRSDSFDRSAQ